MANLANVTRNVSAFNGQYRLHLQRRALGVAARLNARAYQRNNNGNG